MYWQPCPGTVSSPNRDVYSEPFTNWAVTVAQSSREPHAMKSFQPALSGALASALL